MDMGLITGTIATLQGVNDMIKGAVSTKVAQDVGAKILSVQQDMLNMQAAMMTLQQENFRLLSELKVSRDSLGEIDRWNERSALFELRKHPSGVSVYTSKENYGDAIAHACPNCFEDKKIYVLKLHQNFRGGETYQCTSCKNIFTLIPHGPEPVHVVPRSSAWGA